MKATPLTRPEYLLGMGLFLRAHAVRYFRAYELCDVGRRHRGATLTAPPPELWTNILPTLRVLDWLRAELDAPIHVNGAYRDPEYNEAIGGADRSMHLDFNAVDFWSQAVSPAQIGSILEAHPDAKLCGIGVYATFVHLDTRGRLGRAAPARW